MPDDFTQRLLDAAENSVIRLATRVELRYVLGPNGVGTDAVVVAVRSHENSTAEAVESFFAVPLGVIDQLCSQLHQARFVYDDRRRTRRGN